MQKKKALTNSGNVALLNRLFTLTANISVPVLISENQSNRPSFGYRGGGGVELLKCQTLGCERERDVNLLFSQAHIYGDMFETGFLGYDCLCWMRLLLSPLSFEENLESNEN